MAKHLNRMRMIALLSFVAMYSAVSAEELRDPTMPPSQFITPRAGSSEVAPAPVLQSVMLGTQQKAAMINGQFVALGKKYGQDVLVKISASEVVLQAADGSRKVLSMKYPLEKKLIEKKLIDRKMVGTKTLPTLR